MNQTIHGGVAPNVAPGPNKDELRDQVEALEERISDLKDRKKEAKQKHEDGLLRARELRSLLADAERQNSMGDYEKLVNEEHELMSRAQLLRNLLTSKVSTGAGGK